ncbi:hypothetical protein ACOMHN_033706 [Nucella lapillus]
MGEAKDVGQTARSRQHQDAVQDFCSRLAQCYGHFLTVTGTLTHEAQTAGQRLALALRQQEQFASRLKQDLLAGMAPLDPRLWHEVRTELDVLHSAYSSSMLHVSFALAQAVLHQGHWLQAAVLRDFGVAGCQSRDVGLYPPSLLARSAFPGVPPEVGLSWQALSQVGVPQVPHKETCVPQEIPGSAALLSPTPSSSPGLSLAASSAPLTHSYPPSVHLPPPPPSPPSPRAPPSPCLPPPSLSLNPYGLTPSFSLPFSPHPPPLSPSTVPSQVPTPYLLHASLLPWGHCLSPVAQISQGTPTSQLHIPPPFCLSPAL